MVLSSSAGTPQSGILPLRVHTYIRTGTDKRTVRMGAPWIVRCLVPLSMAETYRQYRPVLSNVVAQGRTGGDSLA